MKTVGIIRSYLLNGSRNVIFQRSSIIPSWSEDQAIYYSSYGPHFINPYVTKEKLQELAETGEDKNIQHIPIKAALNHQTSSIFHDELTRKFTNHVMRCGNKVLARSLVEKTFVNIKHIQLEKYNKAEGDSKSSTVIDPVKILHSAIKNCQPLLELIPVKRGGVRYQVPVPITEKRSLFLAIKWLIEAAKEKERTVHFPEKLCWELLDAAANQGRVVKRKVDLHRQCEANKAFAHYRWS